MSKLMTYNATQQHWGTYVSGFDWNIYGCGTYRKPVGEPRAEALMKRFMERLGKKLKTHVAYFAAMERRFSGCGLSAIALHWHFLAACDGRDDMAVAAERLWQDQFGDAKVDPYVAGGSAPYYVCKLADHASGTFLADLDGLLYRGPADLIAAAHANPYVPDYLKDKTHGEYLVIR